MHGIRFYVVVIELYYCPVNCHSGMPLTGIYCLSVRFRLKHCRNDDVVVISLRQQTSNNINFEGTAMIEFI